LPEAHVEAPSVGSVILAGILLKLGGYGLLRVVYPCFPEAVVFYFPFLATLCFIGILYPAFIAVRQLDLKRIIAYSSVSHMNLIVLGIFSSNVEGLMGSCFLMISHGIVASLFFFLVGFLYERHGSRLYLYYGGLCKIMPFFSLCLLIACLSNIGLPGTCNFVGEFLLLLGLGLKNKFLFFFSVSTIIFSSVYTLFFYNRLCFGNLSSFFISYEDLTFLETFIVAPLLFLIFILGLIPSLLMDVLGGSSFLLLEKFK
jgi:NADH-quinone oxidoreductase subunit M